MKHFIILAALLLSLVWPLIDFISDQTLQTAQSIFSVGDPEDDFDAKFIPAN